MCSINMIIKKTQETILEVLLSDLRDTLSRLSEQTVTVIVTVKKSVKREHRIFIGAKGNTVYAYTKPPFPYSTFSKLY